MEYYKEYKPHYAKRIVWRMVNVTLFRLCCIGFMRPVSQMLLRAFGAEIGSRTLVYGSCDIFAPWNLVVKDHSCIGKDCIIYNKDKIVIGKHTVVSQYSYLCSASHDYTDTNHPLITAPIEIGNNVWVAANVFIGMGVKVGDGAVIGATSSVYKNVEPWTVVGGNPAKYIKDRIIQN